MAFPLVVRAVRLSIEQINPDLEHAALTLGPPNHSVFHDYAAHGVTRYRCWCHFRLCQGIGGIWGNNTFVGNIPNQTQTIPSAIYGFLQMPGKDQGALTLVFVSIVISVTALLLSEWLARRVQKRMHGQ